MGRAFWLEDSVLRDLVPLPRYASLCLKYRPYGQDPRRAYTMIPRRAYIANLMAAARVRSIPGCVVECGVWRGGMIAGIAEVLGDSRAYHLFDSFEGLPTAEEIDGPAAVAYQADKTSPRYLDNCRAEEGLAMQAMKMSGVSNFHLHKGWFSDTLPHFQPETPIALLRLDGDWYESTMTCLTNLWDHLAPGAIVLVDDYYTWDGCSRAVHRFLADRQATARIDRMFGYVAAIRTS